MTKTRWLQHSSSLDGLTPWVMSNLKTKFLNAILPMKTLHRMSTISWNFQAKHKSRLLHHFGPKPSMLTRLLWKTVTKTYKMPILSGPMKCIKSRLTPTSKRNHGLSTASMKMSTTRTSRQSLTTGKQRNSINQESTKVWLRKFSLTTGQNPKACSSIHSTEANQLQSINFENVISYSCAKCFYLFHIKYLG